MSIGNHEYNMYLFLINIQFLLIGDSSLLLLCGIRSEWQFILFGGGNGGGSPGRASAITYVTQLKLVIPSVSEESHDQLFWDYYWLPILIINKKPWLKNLVLKICQNKSSILCFIKETGVLNPISICRKSCCTKFQKKFWNMKIKNPTISGLCPLSPASWI